MTWKPEPERRGVADPVAGLRRHVQQMIPGAALRWSRPPLAPELELLLLDERVPFAFTPGPELNELMSDPPYWALCWASGHALAEYVLSHPEEVAGKRVLDFGAGSGVVAIAAALAGADQVFACDLDPMALKAIAANAHHNGVAVTPVDGIHELAGSVDLLLAADVLYDASNHPVLEELRGGFPQMLLADSRYPQSAVVGFDLLGERQVELCPALDVHADFGHVRLFRSTAKAQ